MLLCECEKSYFFMISSLELVLMTPSLYIFFNQNLISTKKSKECFLFLLKLQRNSKKKNYSGRNKTLNSA